MAPDRVAAEMDLRGAPVVGKGDDRGHRPPPIAQGFVDLQGTVQVLARLHEHREDRQLADDRFQRLAVRHAFENRKVLTPLDPIDEPGPHPGQPDGAQLTQGGREVGLVSELLGDGRRTLVGLGRSIEVGLGRCRRVPLADRHVEQVLAQLETCGKLVDTIAGLRGSPAHVGGQLPGAVMVVVETERGGASQHHLELEGGVAGGLRERGKLGQAVQPVRLTAEHVQRVVTSPQERHPLGPGCHHGQRLLDEPERLLRGIGAQRRRDGADREASTPLRVARCQGVARQDRQLLRGRIAVGSEDVDDGAVHCPPARGRQQTQAELPHLFVREPVVRARCVVDLPEESGRDGRRERVRQRRRAAAGVPQPGPDGDEIRQSEAPAEHGRLGQGRLRRILEVRRPPLDERSHRGREQPFRLRVQPPGSVDALHEPGLAVAAHQLLDDQRDALCLRMEGGRTRRVDRTTQGSPQELGRLGLAEPCQGQPPDEAHPLQVGQEVDQLRGGCRLLGPHREHEQHLQRRLVADDVAEQAQAIGVGPLDIVQHQDEGSFQRHHADRARRFVQRAEHPLVRWKAAQCRIAAGERVPCLVDRLDRRRACSVANRRTREDPAGKQERPPDLLVRGHVDGHEAFGHRSVGSRDQQARLADPRLARETDGKDPLPRTLQGGLQGVQLHRAPDDTRRGLAVRHGSTLRIAGHVVARHRYVRGHGSMTGGDRQILTQRILRLISLCRTCGRIDRVTAAGHGDSSRPTRGRCAFRPGPGGRARGSPVSR